MSKKGLDTLRFCYPIINVAGIPKCGTTAVYSYLIKNYFKPSTKVKEYCPRKALAGTGSFYDYFSNFVDLYKNRGYHVNGCINTKMEVILHDLLYPESIYIIMIRDLASYLWADYNFWCSPDIDKNCGPGAWTREGMYRDPVIFDQYLKAAESAKGSKSMVSILLPCLDYANFFFDFEFYKIDWILNRPYMPLLVVPMEGLKDNFHIKRIESFINTNLHTNFTLVGANVSVVNANNHANIEKESHSFQEGVYPISHYKPMLNSTRDYIMKCWKQCKNISKLAQYNFNCFD